MSGPWLEFLGTGAAGGTPGAARSRRRESSAAVGADQAVVLFDVTRDFSDQAAALDRIDAVALTHAHRDAAGGMAQFGRWWRRQDRAPIPVHGHPAALARVAERHRRLEHCDLRPVEPGRGVELLGWQLRCIEVPHGGTSFPTLAWRLDGHGTALVYTSDLAEPTEELARFAAGADHLVIDGAMWARRIFSHLRVDEDLAMVCRWDVASIWLTQIGRSAPSHQRLLRETGRLCRRAAPAHDGLRVALP